MILVTAGIVTALFPLTLFGFFVIIASLAPMKKRDTRTGKVEKREMQTASKVKEERKEEKAQTGMQGFEQKGIEATGSSTILPSLFPSPILPTLSPYPYTTMKDKATEERSDDIIEFLAMVIILSLLRS